MMGKVREGNYISFAIMEVVSHVWTWHLFAFDLVNWVFSLLPSWYNFMSHVTPLSLSKNSSPIIALCPGIFLVNSMLPSLQPCRSMFKGNLCWEFSSTFKTTFVSDTFKSILWLLHTQIPKICSEFRVIDLGFIMTLLRRDYSCRLQLILWELFLETK